MKITQQIRKQIRIRPHRQETRSKINEEEKIPAQEDDEEDEKISKNQRRTKMKTSEKRKKYEKMSRKENKK